MTDVSPGQGGGGVPFTQPNTAARRATHPTGCGYTDLTPVIENSWLFRTCTANRLAIRAYISELHREVAAWEPAPVPLKGEWP